MHPQKTKFTARTRLRGTIDFYQAEWTRHERLPCYTVRFLAGPHQGEEFKQREVAIAAAEKHYVEVKNEDFSRIQRP